MSLYKIRIWKQVIKSYNKQKESKSINSDFTDNLEKKSNTNNKPINMCIVMKDQIEELRKKMEQGVFINNLEHKLYLNKQNELDELNEKVNFPDLEYKNSIKFDPNYLEYL